MVLLKKHSVENQADDCSSIRKSKAKKDQEHIPTIIYSFPQVPDRTTAIQSGDSSIIPYLIEGVTRSRQETVEKKAKICWRQPERTWKKRERRCR